MELHDEVILLVYTLERRGIRWVYTSVHEIHKHLGMDGYVFKLPFQYLRSFQDSPNITGT